MAQASNKPARQPIRFLGSSLLTLIFIGLAGLILWQGTRLIAARAQADENDISTDPVSVSVQTIKQQQQYITQRSFTGQLEAPQLTDLSFEQGGTLATVSVDEGDRVNAGQIVARLDNRQLDAEVTRLTASRAALLARKDLATQTDRRQRALQGSGFTSDQSADEARVALLEIEAQIAETDAAIAAAQIRLEKSVLRAQFDGAVSKRQVDPGNTVGSGQVVMSVLESSEPVFRVGIDPQVASTVALGDAMQIRLNNELHEATVISVSPQIEAATRTQIVRAQLLDEPLTVFGTTGEAHFSQSFPATGAWVPVSALESGVRGLWTIKTVTNDEPATVQLEAVEIIHTDGESAYVNGTFSDGARFIDQGVHRVVAGQAVRVQASVQSDLNTDLKPNEPRDEAPELLPETQSGVQPGIQSEAQSRVQ